MTKAKYPIRRYSIQRFLGCTDGPTFHEPVFLVVDERTVRFTMCVPDPAFLSKIAFSPFAIYEREWYERELLALETKLEAAERILETQAAMFKNYEALAAAQEEET